MAVKSKAGTAAVQHVPAKPKKTRQGQSLHSSLSATSRNGRRKRYRGQGR